MDNLDLVFFALSDPGRRAMLRQLAAGEQTVGELSAPLDLAPATISKHLQVLDRAGLILRRRQGRRRYNRLNPSALHAGVLFMKDLADTWTAQLDRLERLFADEEQP